MSYAEAEVKVRDTFDVTNTFSNKETDGEQAWDKTDSLEDIYIQQMRMETDQAGEEESASAVQYLSRKKEEAITALKAKFADKIWSYEAIKNHNIRALTVLNVIGGIEINIGTETDFFS